MMEAMAFRLGVQMARDQGIAKLCLETDCLELVGVWKEVDAQRSPISFILQEIKSMCRGFDEFTLCYVPRLCNRVAHMCARQVSREQTRVVWLSNPPVALQNLINIDCNPSSLS